MQAEKGVGGTEGGGNGSGRGTEAERAEVGLRPEAGGSRTVERAESQADASLHAVGSAPWPAEHLGPVNCFSGF